MGTTSLNRIDPGTLGWVRTEIDHTLDQARQALADYRRERSDVTPLRMFASHLHQVVGTLQMVELDGAAQLAQESERLADALIGGGSSEDPAPVTQLLESSLSQLSAYLETLQRGAPDVPARNMAILNELRQARGESAIDEFTLFSPDLEVYPSARSARDLDEQTFCAEVRELRRGFQTQLLAWLRNQNTAAALQGMTEGIDALRGLSRLARGAQLWWIARAFVDVLAQAGELAADDPRKRVMGRLEQSMRLLAEHGEAALARDGTEDLVKRMLYEIGRAEADSPAVAEVSRAFELDVALGREDDDRAPVEVPLEQLQALHEGTAGQLRKAQDGLAQYSEQPGRPAALAQVVEALGAMTAQAQQLRIEPLAALLTELCGLAGVLQREQVGEPEQASLQLASALLFVKEVLEQPQDNQWVALAADKAQRLHALQTDQVDLDKLAAQMPSGGSEALSDYELTRLLGAVAQQIYVNLDVAEQALEAYARGHDRASLAAVPENLAQVEGALRILGQHKVCDLIQVTVDHLAALMNGELSLSEPLIDALAVAIGTVETYVRGLEQKRPRLNELLERALHDLEYAVSDSDLHHIDPREAIGSLGQQLNRWLDDSADYQAFRKLRHHLREVSALAHRREKLKPRRIALEMNNLLDIVTEDPSFLSPEVEQTLRRSLDTLAGLADELAEQVPRAETAAVEVATPATAPSEDDEDEEIKQIFLEEAQECVAAIDEHYAAWRRDPEDRDALAELRRQFHTIKGSGRTAQAGEVAELAWVIEDLLNRLLEGDLPHSDAVFVLVQDARIAIAGLLDSKLAGSVELADWQQRAEELMAEPSAPAPAKAATTLPDRESVIDIFLREARGHITTLVETLDACMRDARACRVTRELGRAAHTLMGSSRSMQFQDMATAYEAFEQLLQTLDRGGMPLQTGELEIIAQLAETTEQALTQLAAQGVFPAELGAQWVSLGERCAAREQERRERPAASPATTEDASPATSRLEQIVPEDIGREIRGEGTVALPPTPVEEVNPEIQDIFCEEASDILRRIESAIEQWRHDHGDQDSTAALKRDLHTLKGSARAAGADLIGDLGHNAETLLERAGEGNRHQDIAALLALIEEVHDTLVDMVQRTTRRQRLPDISDLNLRLSAFDEQRAAPVVDIPGLSVVPPVAVDGEQSEPAVAARREVSATPTAEGSSSPRRDDDRVVRVRPQVLDKLVTYAGEVSIARAQIQEQLSGLKGNLNELRTNISRFGEQLRELDIQADSQIRARAAALEEPEPGHDFDPLEFDRYTKLQQLARGLSESLDDLVTIQSGLGQFANRTESVLQQQAHLNTELQDGLMSTRLVPFSTITPRLRHHVRQTARELGKEAELSVVGGEVELDRNILDGLTEALEHMVRNAIDHGIEAGAERSRAGKQDAGRIAIECRQEGNEVVIRFGDDGRGLDVERIRARALDSGLIQAESRLTDQELIQLIVLAGFTTTDTVTKLSGRGVGLDVVHNTVRRLGGSITVESEPERGTTFVLRLPLSLSIAQALFVRCGYEEYAISLGVIDRILKADPHQLERRDADGMVLFEHDGQEYPVLDLTRRLGLERGTPAPGRVPLLIVRMGARDVAVRVEELLSTQEVVVKSLGGHIAAVEGLAGATVRGDGSVVLILDLAALWLAEERAPHLPADTATERSPIVMVVDDSLTVRKVTSRNLHRYGIDVLMAKDGIDALEQMRKQRPDLMLVDIEMPRMDGYELTSRVRGDAATQDIPIIMITSRAGAKHRDKAMQLGATGYLTKPYQEEALVSQVRSLLAGAAAAQAGL